MTSVQRAKELSRELAGNPFFPLLFVGKVAETLTTHLVAGDPGVDIVAAHTIAAIACVLLWLYSYDDVAWGIQQVEETVEEVTDEQRD